MNEPRITSNAERIGTASGGGKLSLAVMSRVNQQVAEKALSADSVAKDPISFIRALGFTGGENREGVLVAMREFFETQRVGLSSIIDESARAQRYRELKKIEASLMPLCDAIPTADSNPPQLSLKDRFESELAKLGLPSTTVAASTSGANMASITNEPPSYNSLKEFVDRYPDYFKGDNLNAQDPKLAEFLGIRIPVNGIDRRSFLEYAERLNKVSLTSHLKALGDTDQLSAENQALVLRINKGIATQEDHQRYASFVGYGRVQEAVDKAVQAIDTMLLIRDVASGDYGEQVAKRRAVREKEEVIWADLRQELDNDAALQRQNPTLYPFYKWVRKIPQIRLLGYAATLGVATAATVAGWAASKSGVWANVGEGLHSTAPLTMGIALSLPLMGYTLRRARERVMRVMRWMLHEPYDVSNQSVDELGKINVKVRATVPVERAFELLQPAWKKWLARQPRVTRKALIKQYRGKFVNQAKDMIGIIAEIFSDHEDALFQESVKFRTRVARSSIVAEAKKASEAIDNFNMHGQQRLEPLIEEYVNNIIQVANQPLATAGVGDHKGSVKGMIDGDAAKAAERIQEHIRAFESQQIQGGAVSQKVTWVRDSGVRSAVLQELRDVVSSKELRPYHRDGVQYMDENQMRCDLAGFVNKRKGQLQEQYDLLLKQIPPMYATNVDEYNLSVGKRADLKLRQMLQGVHLGYLVSKQWGLYSPEQRASAYWRVMNETKECDFRNMSEEQLAKEDADKVPLANAVYRLRYGWVTKGFDKALNTYGYAAPAVVGLYEAWPWISRVLSIMAH